MLMDFGHLIEERAGILCDFIGQRQRGTGKNDNSSSKSNKVDRGNSSTKINRNKKQF
jgi:hypothetical protein